MARIPSPKIDEIANPRENDGKLTRVALITVNSNGEVQNSYPKAPFLLNPSSYRETLGANWAAQTVPMQSRPIYQYVAGTPRTITFEALVTRDTIHYGKSSFIENVIDKAFNAVGDIASKFAGVSLPPVTDLFSFPGPAEGTQLSVADYLMYYRSLVHPIYSEGYKSISSSPPLVILAVGRSFSDIGSSDKITGPSGPNVPYLPIWMVKNIDINITKMLPNSDPMEARVTFVLEEYAIRPISGGNFVAKEPVQAITGGTVGAIAGAIGGFF